MDRDRAAPFGTAGRESRADAAPSTGETFAPEQIERAAAVLLGGGLVGVPTDTVYGLAALPGNRRAVQRALRASGRPPDGMLPLLIASLDDLPRVAAATPEPARRLARRFWPGPLTLVLRRAPGLRGVDGADGEYVAVRMPASAGLRDLLAAASGALVVTSVAVTAGGSSRSPRGAMTALRRHADLVIDGGPLPPATVSTMVDFSRGRPRLLREGPLTREELTLVALVRIG